MASFGGSLRMCGEETPTEGAIEYRHKPAFVEPGNVGLNVLVAARERVGRQQ